MEAVRIRTDQAESGMKVASDIYNLNNQMIIPKGTVLDERMITRLRFYNIYGLLVYNDDGQEAMKEESYIDALRNTQEFKKFSRTYVDTVNSVENNFNNVINGDNGFDVDELLAETDRILKEGRNGAHVMEMLHGIRNYDDMTYVHSLNVSLICNIFAGWLKFSHEDTRILTLGGLLHDIGKMLVPKEIITKAGKLTEEEYKVVQTHAIKGYQAIKDHPIDIRVKYATLMHHERCDGSGYPYGFYSEQIDSFAKLVAIADVYDAMTCARVYRGPLCPFDVVSIFETEGYSKYDPKYIMTFLESIVQTYIHNSVKLSNGIIGEIIMINKMELSRPVIKAEEAFIDLAKQRDLQIVSLV